jgi:drug/metabolite transporter (DMT)-like permease
MLYGAIVAAIAALMHGVPWHFDASAPYLLSLAYLSIFGSVVAFCAYLTLMKQVGPARAAYVGIAVPIVAMALSTLFEGYRWTWTAVLGVVLAVIANWIALKPAPAASGALPSGRLSPRRLS